MEPQIKVFMSCRMSRVVESVDYTCAVHLSVAPDLGTAFVDGEIPFTDLRSFTLDDCVPAQI